MFAPLSKTKRLVPIKEAAFELLQHREGTWRSSNFDSLHEVYMVGMAILGFRMGLRADTLMKLDIDMYAHKVGKNINTNNLWLER